MSFRDFEKLDTLTKLSGTLVNETPLRIGVGREPPLGAPVDLAVYRVAGTPCIPGSSLKGVFRSFAEALARSKGLAVHSPWDEPAINQEGRSGQFCVICGIFGNTQLASHVRVYDAYPKDRQAARTFVKTSIAIDREFRSVKAEALFREELVLPHVEWDLKVDIFNIKAFPEPDPDDDRAVLLRELLRALRSVGLQVGARKSVGCGLIKLKDGSWSVYQMKNGVLEKVEEGKL